MTTATASITEAIRFLAGRCDWAATRDDQGFSGVDTGLGHFLAALPDDQWTPAQKYEGYQLTRKYRRQLEEGGFDVEGMEEPPRPEGNAKAIRDKAQTDRVAQKRGEIRVKDGAVEAIPDRRLELEGGEFKLSFKYDSALVDAGRNIEGRRYVGQDKTNRYPLTPGAAHGLKGFLDRFDGFEVSEEAAAKLEELAEGPPPAWGSITLEDEAFIVTFPYEREVVGALQRVTGRRWDGKRKVNRVPREAASGEQLTAFLADHRERGWDVSDEATAEMEKLCALVQEQRAAAGKLKELSVAEDAEIEIPGLGGELRPFQKAGVKYVKKTRRTFIADDMGTGKTVQALAAAQAEDAFPMIVVCPQTMKLAWRKHVVGPTPGAPNGWLPGKKVRVLSGRKPNARLLQPTRKGSDREIAESRKRLAALDEKVRLYAAQHGLNVAASLDVPAILDALGEAINDGLPRVAEAAEGQQPVDQSLVGGVDADAPRAAGQGDAALPVEDAREIPDIDGSGGSDEGGGGALTAGDRDAATLDERTKRGLRDADILSDLTPSAIAEAQALYGFLQLQLSDLTKLTHVEIVIINYDVLAPWVGTLKAMRPQTLVLDESHYVKSSKAQRTKAAKSLAKVIPATGLVLNLTGTANKNRPIEFASQLDVLGRLGDFGGFMAFAKRYCGAFHDGYGWNMQGATNLKELNEKLRASCYIRRRKSDIMKELPPKQIATVPVELSNRREYDRVEADVISWLRDTVVNDAEFLAEIADLPEDEQRDAKRRRASEAAARAERAEKLVKINKLRLVAGQGKIKAAAEWIDDFLSDGDEKLVVFADHIEVQKTLLQELRKYKPVHVLGEDSSEDRQEAVRRFQENEDTRLIVCSIKAAGIGITLTAATNVLMVESAWTPSDMDQAEDRLHRMGQEGQVTVWNMVAEDSFDEDMADLIASKREVVTAATDGREDESRVSVMSEAIDRLLGKRA